MSLFPFIMQIMHVAELIRYLGNVMSYVVVRRNEKELFKSMIDYCQYIDISSSKSSDRLETEVFI